MWTLSTVTKILQNQMYVGDMVQGKSRTISYKIHKRISVPKEEWVIVPNTHEAIISSKMFEQAQEINRGNVRSLRNGKSELSIFAGRIKCFECGSSMMRHKVKKNIYYYCQKYTSRFGKSCSKNTTRCEKIENAVKLAIQSQIKIVTDFANMLDKINDNYTVNTKFNLFIEKFEQAKKI